MAPKKKQPTSKQEQKQKKKQKSYPSSSSSATVTAAAAPRLRIFPVNERRLRRLLLKSSAPAPAPADGAAAHSESREQKARRLRGVYDKLALEGFSFAQIEQALSALSDLATFESALDWLFINLPSDELPLKFSSGGSSTSRAGSVNIRSTTKNNWVPQNIEPMM